MSISPVPPTQGESFVVDERLVLSSSEGDPISFIDLIGEKIFQLIENNPAPVTNRFLNDFILRLTTEGLATFEGVHSECETIRDQAEAYIQRVLAELIEQREVIQIITILLDQLPDLSLRKEISPIIQRTQTIRNLLRENNQVISVYSQTAFDRFSEQTDQESLTERAVWERIQFNPQLHKIPLPLDIPSEFRGALYIINSSENEKFYLCIQSQSLPSGTTCLTMWIAPSTDLLDPGTVQALSVLDFLDQNN